MDAYASISSFAEEFLQDVVSESEAGGKYSEEAFVEKDCDDILVEAGEIEDWRIVSYRGPAGSGVRVDAWGGDPEDNEAGVLSLIVSDFNPSVGGGRLTKTEMEEIFRRPMKFLRKSLDSKWRNSLEESSRAFGLADLVSQRWGGVNRIRLFLISNRQLSDRVDRMDAGSLDGKEVTYNVWDLKRLYECSNKEREEISIDLERDHGGALPALFAQQAEAEHKSYLTILPGEILARIYDCWGPRLLENNVRVFLQARGKVNKQIKRTLESEPTMFFCYNNGIAATAESVEMTGSDKDRMFLSRMENFQIVNGGQTTASVHRAFRDGKDLSQIFIQMKLSVVEPACTKEVVPRISEYANSQNRVGAADFYSNHPFHIRIEKFSRRIFAPSPDGTLRETKWFYERARGQYADARSLLTRAERKKFDLEHPRSQLFAKTDLAKFINVWRSAPHKVSLGAQKNFVYFLGYIGQKWAKQEDDISEDWYREAIAKAIIFRATEKLVTSQEWYQGGYRANIVAYAIAKMAWDVSGMKKSVDFQKIWRRQSIDEIMESSLALVAGEVHEVLINTSEGIGNVTEWAKKEACWAEVRKLNISWPSDFVHGLISADDKKESDTSARKEQKVLSGIEAQIKVVEAGPEFWRRVWQWGKERGLLSSAENDLFNSVTKYLERAPAEWLRVPSEWQSKNMIEAHHKLWEEGFSEEIPSNK